MVAQPLSSLTPGLGGQSSKFNIGLTAVYRETSAARAGMWVCVLDRDAGAR